MDKWEEEFPIDADLAIVREVEERGAKRERERIITLLEELRDSEYAEVMTHDDVVALIKGEN